MKTNQQRADATKQAVALYNTGANNEAEALCDLLCDLQHLCARDPSHGPFQDALRLATAHFLFETEDPVVPSGEPAEVPTVVIDIDGGAVHSVRSNMPIRVVILDADTQGSDGERIQTIEGIEVYVHDRQIQSGSDNISADGVRAVLLELEGEAEEHSVATPADNSAPVVISAESVGTLPTCYLEAYAAHLHGEGPGFACVTPGADFLSRLRTAVRRCDNLGLTSVSFDGAPDSWGPGEIAMDLQLIDSELVVTGSAFWFQATVKHAGYHVETRAQDVEDFCRAVEDATQERLFFGENDDLEAEVLDALGVVDCLGIPQSCGKPLCGPGHHHPLCALARRRDKPSSGLDLVPDALSGSGQN